MKASTSTPAKPSIGKSHSIPIVTQYAEPSAKDHAAVEISGDSSSDDIANAVRVGAWETPRLCCIGASVGLWVNTCLAWCLPCLSFAQITHRLGLAKFWLVLVLFVALVVAEYFVWYYASDLYTTSPMWTLVSLLINSIYTAATSEELHVENIYLQDTQVAIFVGTGMWAFVGIVTGSLMIVLAWALRSRVRARFSIPGSCCLDGFAAFFCSCCTVAQMATHLKIHKKRLINVGPAGTLPAFPQL